MTSYFISDLHLQANTPKLTQGFYSFVENIAHDAKQLYILGDFFDAWIGDDEDEPFYLEVMAKLKRYSDNGLRIYFMHGNRDFLIAEAFAKKTGVILLNDPSMIEIGGQKVLLMHGDSLCTHDEAYIQFRQQVRSAPWQQHVLGLPLEQRRAMAAQLRTQSQAINSNKAEDIMDVNPVDVAQQFSTHKMDILLHGHTHRPARHNMGATERIVLGDWGTTGWYVRSQGSQIELIEFNLS